MGRPQHGGTSGTPRRLGSPGCKKLVFPQRTAGDSARWRYARGCQRHKRRCGCTSCTGTSTTPWLYWRRATLPLPRCPQCDLQVFRKDLNGRHLETSQCRKGTEQKRRRLAETELETTSEKAFHAYRTKIRAVTEFKYLGRILTNTDGDWPAVAGNIRKARASWGRLARILVREGADLKVTRSF